MSIHPVFVGKFKVEGECWIWTGCIHANGYAQIRYKKETLQAHRLSYRFHVGFIPDDKFVLHRCDVRHCINPDHLFLGTNQDNMLDMITKSRHIGKLSQEEVLEIRNTKAYRGITYRLAEKYGVCQQLISLIRTNKIWKQLS
jgi:hypothetical protein